VIFRKQDSPAGYRCHVQVQPRIKGGSQYFFHHFVHLQLQAINDGLQTVDKYGNLRMKFVLYAPTRHDSAVSF